MACYESWNSAIASYFVAGARKGSHIFLSLDDEAIEDIAVEFINEPVDTEPVGDFIAAVRSMCLPGSGGELTLRPFDKHLGRFPGGVAFLGSMVLAAYRMQEEAGIDESNYFLRFREVLELPPIPGRPDGMPPGAEESLWIAWNRFLEGSGFLPSAERGSGPQTYLRYGLSQAILRESDKQFLRQRYAEKNLSPQLDIDQLGFWLSRQQINRKHLHEGLRHVDPARAWEFNRAAYRVYEESDWLGGNVEGGSVRRRRVRSIESGIYRAETLDGESQYYIFPRQPERSRDAQLYVSRACVTEQEPLRQLRAGYFRPLWQQEPFVDEPLHFDISGDPHIQGLVFPSRDFWILTADPETTHGAFATWKPFLELGEKLIILCRAGSFADEMARLRQDRLIDWSNHANHGDWVEYFGCMVLSYDWGGFISDPKCRGLANALTPHSAASVALSGGLRDRNQNAWLVGFPPTLRLYGFEKQFEITVKTTGGIEILEKEVASQQEFSLPDALAPDAYEIEVRWNGKRIAGRMFRMISWDDIQENPALEEIVNSSPISTAGLRLRGPVIIDDTVDTGEVSHS